MNATNTSTSTSTSTTTTTTQTATTEHETMTNSPHRRVYAGNTNRALSFSNNGEQQDDVELAPYPSPEKDEEVSALIGISKERDAPPSSSKHAIADDGHGAALPGTASTQQLIVNIIISFVGAGILGVPEAFQKSGWFLGSVTLLVVCGLNTYAMLLLPQVQKVLLHRGGFEDCCHSYGEVGRCIMGKTGEAFLNLCLGISQAGFATAYIIFIAANLNSIANIPRSLVCAACVPGLAALVQFREMKHLSPFSLLANCSNFAALCAVLFQDYESYQPHNDTIRAVKWDGFLYVIAISIYCMEGVGMILSLEASYKERSKFGGVFQTVIVVISVFMAFFGTAGYLAFGESTLAPITLNLANNWSSSFVKCALSLGLYLTYPIMMFPVWSIAEKSAFPSMADHRFFRIGFRCCVVLLSALVAFAVPDFGKFLSLVGSSICTILGFIFPCYFHLSVNRGDLTYFQMALDVILICGGLLFGVMGTYNSALAMLRGELVGE